MVEQFRVNAMEMEQTQLEASIKFQIEVFITSDGGMAETFEGLAAMLRGYFGIEKVTIVYAKDGGATAFSDTSAPYAFLAHDRIDALLNSRKIVFMNRQAIAGAGIDFLHPQTISACFAPLRQTGGNETIGYIIFENNSIKKTLSEGTESIIMYISEIMSSWLSAKVWHTPEAGGDGMDGSVGFELDVLNDETPEDAAVSPVIDALREIAGMDVDAAIDMMGGLRDAYEKTVRLMARLLPDTIAKLDKYLSENSVKGFTVEIHGIKGVLRNIGASMLGSGAVSLETAAIEGNLEYCRDHYPAFKEKLAEFSERLNAVLESGASVVKEQIKREPMLAVLAEAKAAAEGYDSMRALNVLARLEGCSYSAEADKLIESIVFALEEFDCASAINNIIKIEKEIL
jgi:HPt (histidine-containing phosphotransfer) domain-containing protein